MPVMDEFKKERETIKTAPLSKKLQYFADYYLLKTILIILVAGVAIAYVISRVTAKDTALYVTLVNFNSIADSSEGFYEPFAQEHINTRKQEIIIDNSSFISSDENEVNFIKYGYEDEQKLFSLIMTGEIDLLITGEDVIERYAVQDWFDDLREILDEKALADYESSKDIKYWKGVPIAIRIDPSRKLDSYYYYNGKENTDIYVAFTANSTHRELAVAFAEYLNQ